MITSRSDAGYESGADAERELEESEQRLRVLADAAFEAILIHDRGTIITANQAFAEMFGVELTDIIGGDAVEFATPETRPLILDRIRTGSEEPYRAVGMRSDGTTFTAELRGKPIPYHGRTVRATAIRDLSDRLVAERAMREVEGRLTRLIESLPVAVLLVDKSGKPRFINHVAEELLGKGIRGLGPQARAEQLPDVYQMYVSNTDALYPYDRSPIIRALTGKQVTVEDVEIRRPDRTIPIEVTAAPVFDENGEVSYAVMVFKDITGRRAAENAMREAERKYREMFEHSINAIFQSTTGGRFITVNRAMARIWGFDSPEEMIASIDDIAERYVEPERREEFIRRMERDGFVQWFEAEVYREDGSTFWMRVNARSVTDARGNLLYYEGTVEDVTPRKEAQALLRESEERYRSVVETSPDAITVIDLDYNFIAVNARAAEMYGVEDPGNMVGMSVLDTVSPEDRAMAFQNSLKVLESGEVRRGEYTLLRADGSGVPVEISASRIVDAAGAPAAVVAIVRDITERKRSEQALQQVNAELEGFAQTVSHGLQGPLASIGLAAEALRAELGRTPGVEAERLAEIVSSIETKAHGSVELVEDLLALAEAGNVPYRVEEVSVSEVLSEVLAERVERMESAGLEVSVDGDMGMMKASRTHMHQLFGGLVDNVLAHNSSENPSLTVRYLGSVDGAGRYRVYDNGPGIPEDLLDTAFLPFVRGKGGSTGIGLAIVDRIVGLYGGTIKVSNRPGACFEFELRGLSPKTGGATPMPGVP